MTTNTSPNILHRIAKKIFFKTLSGVKGGSLELVCRDGTYHFGDGGFGEHADGEEAAASAVNAVVAVNDDRFFMRALLAGDIGVGEAYMDGDWSTPDLVAVVRLAVRNLGQLDGSNRLFTAFRRTADFIAHRGNRNTQSGSRRNVSYHYDLGNDFYRLFLDRNLAYSCAYYERADESLEQAQINKFDRICRKLDLNSQDHVLEIGTGWGGFAAYAAETYGCRVTTTTISRQQHDYARAMFARIPAGERIELLLEDYRNLKGQYDKIVSIEMFEAVGYEHYDDYFGACNRLLKPQGTMLLQTITILESKFQQYIKQSDWIKKYIFPGAELASVTEIERSLVRTAARTTDGSNGMKVFHLEDIGMHYSLTLHEWRRRFLEQLPEVQRQGFDDRFVHMWDYYLAYCEGAFREGYIGDVQLVLTKVANPRPLFAETDVEPTSAAADHGGALARV